MAAQRTHPQPLAPKPEQSSLGLLQGRSGKPARPPLNPLLRQRIHQSHNLIRPFPERPHSQTPDTPRVRIEAGLEGTPVARRGAEEPHIENTKITGTLRWQPGTAATRRSTAARARVSEALYHDEQ
jgi:hypothetical protein